MTTAPPRKLWVLLMSDRSGAVNRSTQVSTKECDNVDDFIKAIKKELAPKLDHVAVDNITLHLTVDSPLLDPDDDVPAQNNAPTALIVKTNLQPTGSPTFSHASTSSDGEPHPKRLKRWEQINRILLDMKKEPITNESTPYSSARWKSLATVFKQHRRSYCQSTVPIPAGDFEVLVTMLTWIYRSYNYTLYDFMDINEAKRVHLIAPVLWSVVQLLPNVVVHVEHDLHGDRVKAHGHFEFVLTRQVGDKVKRICIVEAKEEQFSQGLALSLLGCEVAADLDDSPRSMVLLQTL